MAALQELLPASFRGVPFYVPHGSVETGRHAVIHTYPDSNTRYVEDNGLAVADFKFEAWVAGPDALSQMRALEGAFQMPGPGILVHPTHGRRFVQIGKISTKHSDESIGIIKFEVEAHETGPPSWPGLVSGIAASISGLAALDITAAFNAFIAQFPNPFSLGGMTLSVVSGAISSIVSTALSAFSNVAGVQVAAGALLQQPQLITVNPAAFAASLQTLLRSPFDAATVSQTALYNGAVSQVAAAAAVASSAAAITPSTVDLARRQQVLTALGTALTVTSYVNLCEAVAGKTYQTAEQVTADIQAVVAAYEATSLCDMETGQRNDLTTLLSETIEVLHQDQVTLPSIISLSLIHI